MRPFFSGNLKNNIQLLRSRLHQTEHQKAVARFVKNVLGFSTSNVDFYSMALIHRSATNNTAEGFAINNERLEYLGDAVLDAIVAEYLFKRFPLKPEGELTEMRAKMVCREQLGKLSRKLHLDELITIQPNVRARSAGGDAFEALIGALFLDKGYEKTKKVVLNNIFNAYLDVDALLAEESDFKSKIHAWAQHSHKKLLFEHQIAEKEHHRCLYRVKLFVDDKLMSEGLDYTVKKAEQVAAERACKLLFQKETSDQK